MGRLFAGARQALGRRWGGEGTRLAVGRSNSGLSRMAGGVRHWHGGVEFAYQLLTQRAWMRVGFMAARRQKKALEQLKRERARRMRAKFPELPNDVEVRMNPPGERKMSEVIMEFLAPEWQREPPPSEGQLQRLLMLGTIAWNAAVMDGEESKDLLQSAAATIPDDLRDDFLLIVNNLIARKKAQFADIKRLIVDFKLTWDPIKPHVAVASTLV